MIFFLKDMSAACLKLCKTGLETRYCPRLAEYWSNAFVSLTGNPAV